MNLLKCRVVLEDTPGALGRVSSALGALGCNIDEVDVQDVDGRQVLDDLLVETPDDLDPDSLSDTLLEAGARSIRILPTPEPVADRQVAAFDAAARLLDAALAGDVDAETQRLLSAQIGADAARFVATGRRQTGVPSGTDEEPAEITGVPSLLADPENDNDVGFSTRAIHERYTATEIGRIRAMMRLKRKAEAIATKLDRAGGAADPQP